MPHDADGATLADLDRAFAQFSERYIQPAVQELSRKVREGEPLTAFERDILRCVRQAIADRVLAELANAKPSSE